jgi:galactose-1-phosphate uridylyltransferase
VIELRSQRKVARLHDPRRDFALTEIESEVRFDPLTGDSARICHFALRVPPAADLEGIVARSRASCPFCPERRERVTPRFPADVLPAGRLRRGAATVVPNLFPYDDVSALAVLGDEHFLPMEAIPVQLVVDGLHAARELMQAALETAQGDTYGIVTWNYMPPAGASQVHPHLQVIVSRDPGNGLRRTLAAETRYLGEHGRTYAADLLAAEDREGVRWIGARGRVAWIAPFTPTGLLGDCAAFFRGRSTLLDLDAQDVHDFAASLVALLAAFSRRGLWSFNLCFFPAAFGAMPDVHWLTAKLLPRFYLNADLHVSDVAYLHLLLEERFAMTRPEEIAPDLRAALAGAG